MLKFFTSVLLISSLFLTGCFFQQKEVSDTRFMMDTVISISATGDSEKTLEQAISAAFNAFKSVADATDPYASHLPQDLFALNKHAGQGPTKVNPILFTLLEETQKLAHPEINLTLGNIISLWQAHSKAQTVPTPEEVKTALALSLSGSLTLNKVDATVTLAPKQQVDLGAVAKGYGVDAAAKVLRTNKAVTSALINAGGNIMVIGTKKDGKPWKIGIQNPRDNQKLLGTLELKPNMAIATSGDYQRYYEVKGVRYHHIIDASTGYPAQGTISATAVASSGFLSDYYSTLLFVLPFDRAKKIVETTAGLEAIIQSAKGELYISPGLKNIFTLAK